MAISRGSRRGDAEEFKRGKNSRSSWHHICNLSSYWVQDKNAAKEQINYLKIKGGYRENEKQRNAKQAVAYA
jgi:hypothetical protein